MSRRLTSLQKCVTGDHNETGCYKSFPLIQRASIFFQTYHPFKTIL